MTTQLKYVHIDSRERLRHETKGKFNVSLGHGFYDCSRVALKSLSIPNSFGNMHLKTLKWFEIVDSSAPGAPQRAYQAAIFEASIYEGEVEDYIDNAELQTLIQSAYEPSKVLTRYMINLDGSKGAGELITERRVFDGQTYTPDVVIQYDTDTYKFTITPTGQANRNHYFGLVDSENSIFKSMGFETVLMNSEGQVYEFLNAIQNNAFEPTFNNNTAKLDYLTYMKNIRSNKPNKFLKADHVSRHENHVREINLCSDVLSVDSYTTKKGLCRPTNILETIVNTSAKFSYLHHSANTLYYHKIDGLKNTFDIQLLDEDGKELTNLSCPDWKAVLIFETVEKIEYHKEAIKKYNNEGYRIGHPF